MNAVIKLYRALCARQLAWGSIVAQQDRRDAIAAGLFSAADDAAFSAVHRAICAEL